MSPYREPADPPPAEVDAPHHIDREVDGCLGQLVTGLIVAALVLSLVGR